MSNFRYLTNGKNNNIVLVVCKDYDTLSMKAAQIIAAQVNQKPDCILGLATGSSPVGLYKKLIEMYENGEIDFKDVKSYNLDEYYPLSPENDQSYRYFMEHNLFYGINIKKENTHVPNGLAKDVEIEGKEYDAAIAAAGGVDLQLLGIGGNGHIGFNEPTNRFIMGTHKVDLTRETIEANSRFFAKIEDVPTQAVTMGIGTIFNARSVLLVANGKAKANAIKAMLEGDVDPSCPASILKLHNKVYVVVDEDAASLLTEWR